MRHAIWMSLQRTAAVMVMLAVGAVGLGFLFASNLRTLVERWTQDAGWSHGFVVPLTDEEKKGAGDMSYIARYRDLVAGMMTLRERGLAIYDLGDVFQNEAGTIYADAVHAHFQGKRSRGYELIADRMAEDLAQAWGLKKLP